MSAGKLTPRQRMINLMYLVFIAMMALNMTKEVLSAFGIMDERLTEANLTITERNNAFMANLAQRASESPDQYGAIKNASDEMQSISVEFINMFKNKGCNNRIFRKTTRLRIPRSIWFHRPNIFRFGESYR